MERPTDQKQTGLVVSRANREDKEAEQGEASRLCNFHPGSEVTRGYGLGHHSSMCR
jgi:hypothetical protein